MPTKKNLKASQTTKPKMVEIEVVEKQAKKIKELEAENKALREALEYYANDSLWSKMGEYDAWCYDGNGADTAQKTLASK